MIHTYIIPHSYHSFESFVYVIFSLISFLLGLWLFHDLLSMCNKIVCWLVEFGLGYVCFVF